MKDVRRKLYEIVEEANSLLRSWGINETIQLKEGREVAKEKWLRWIVRIGEREPAHIFTFLNDAVLGAYFDEPRYIKFTDTDEIVGRPVKKSCWLEYLRRSLPFTVGFFLAIEAFCHYLVAKNLAEQAKITPDALSAVITVTFSPRNYAEIYLPTQRMSLVINGKAFKQGTLSDVLPDFWKMVAICRV